MRKGTIIFILTFGLFQIFPSSPWAQEFPARSINVLIGYAPGGSTDLSVRALASEVSKILKQPVICSNQPGANGTLVLGRVKGEKPDGYTIFSAPTAAFAATPHIQSVPYEPLKDFSYIIQYALCQSEIVVRSDSPWNTLEERMDHVKENPNKIKYVTAGIGSGGHRGAIYLEERYGFKWNHIPVKNGMECVTTLLGGHVEVMSQTTEWKEQVRAGKFRILVITSDQRLRSFPDVPTLREKGHPFAVYSGLCFVGPEGMPAPVVEKLQNAFAQAMKAKPFLDVLDNIDMPSAYLDSASLTKVIPKEYQETGDQFKRLGLGLYKK
jgi:tripartite-type tricarboxylate transporter receptor subunit TctC